MEHMKKIKYKVNLFLLIIIISAGSFSLTSPVEASAQSMFNIKEIPIITSVSDALNQVGYSYYQANLAGTKQSGMYTLSRAPKSVSTSMDLDIDSDSVHYDLRANDVAPEYVGENVFHNDSPTEQTYSTTTYSKAITETTSTTTTRGFTIGGDGKTFSIPLIFSEGLNAMAQFNSSKAEATTNSVTRTLTVPPQQVKVPAHKTYVAVVNLERKVFRGSLSYKAIGTNLRTNITATGMWVSWYGTPSTRTFNFNNRTGDLWNKISFSEQNKVRGITMNSGSNSIKIDGQANIESVVGSKLTVRIYDKGTKKLMKTMELPVISRDKR